MTPFEAWLVQLGVFLMLLGLAHGVLFAASCLSLPEGDRIDGAWDAMAMWKSRQMRLAKIVSDEIERTNECPEGIVWWFVFTSGLELFGVGYLCLYFREIIRRPKKHRVKLLVLYNVYLLGSIWLWDLEPPTCGFLREYGLVTLLTAYTMFVYLVLHWSIAVVPPRRRTFHPNLNRPLMS
eukprot:TRINITY_DN3101_c0_g3_i1.p1 TRINITY_DN3101_c0_g3~~TRINITY_DN3101_c0_g3_i1.p1  ORF type:complete len:180 (+),score=17.60 TRINITY_DN3101_c0_g3_i1:95-634(+)